MERMRSILPAFEEDAVVTVKRVGDDEKMVLRDDARGYKVKFEGDETIGDVSRVLSRLYSLERRPKVKCDNRVVDPTATVVCGEYVVVSVTGPQRQNAKDIKDPYVYKGCLICYDLNYWRSGRRTLPPSTTPTKIKSCCY